MSVILENPVFWASASAILVAVCNVVKRWMELRERSAHRAAVLKLHSNGSALEALATSVPHPTGEINSAPIILLAIGFAAALYSPDLSAYSAAAESARECRTAADCFDGERCERGACVSTSGPRHTTADRRSGIRSGAVLPPQSAARIPATAQAQKVRFSWRSS